MTFKSMNAFKSFCCVVVILFLFLVLFFLSTAYIPTTDPHILYNHHHPTSRNINNFRSVVYCVTVISSHCQCHCCLPHHQSHPTHCFGVRLTRVCCFTHCVFFYSDDQQCFTNCCKCNCFVLICYSLFIIISGELCAVFIVVFPIIYVVTVTKENNNCNRLK